MNDTFKPPENFETLAGPRQARSEKNIDLDEALQDLQTIKSVAAGLTRKRDDVYLLMTVIYRIGQKWLEHRVPRALRDGVVAHEKVRPDHRAKRKIFRFLIELACPVDTKLRSRYANALQYARLRHCPLERLTGFIKSKGGIEKCAKKYIAHKRAVRFKRTTW